MSVSIRARDVIFSQFIIVESLLSRRRQFYPTRVECFSRYSRLEIPERSYNLFLARSLNLICSKKMLASFRPSSTKMTFESLAFCVEREK